MSNWNENQDKLAGLELFCTPFSIVISQNFSTLRWSLLFCSAVRVVSRVAWHVHTANPSLLSARYPAIVLSPLLPGGAGCLAPERIGSRNGVHRLQVSRGVSGSGRGDVDDHDNDGHNGYDEFQTTTHRTPLKILTRFAHEEGKPFVRSSSVAPGTDNLKIGDRISKTNTLVHSCTASPHYRFSL